MELFKFDKSLKNIPISPMESYRKLLLAKTNDFIEHVRWKVFFYLNPKQQRGNIVTFGFRTTKSAPKMKILESFEQELIELITNIETSETKLNTFQKELSKNVKDINK